MAAYRPWQDKGFLHENYVKNRMTIDQIADKCKTMGFSVTPMTIYNNLKKHNLLKNSRNLGSRSVGNRPSTGKGGFYG